MKRKIESVIWKTVKNTKAEQQKKKKRKEKDLKNEENLRNILDNMKHNNICIMGILEESKQGIKNLDEEIMTENLIW